MLFGLYNRDTNSTINQTSIDCSNKIIVFQTQLANIFLSCTYMHDPNAIHNILNIESEINQNGGSALDYHIFFEMILYGPHHTNNSRIQKPH